MGLEDDREALIRLQGRERSGGRRDPLPKLGLVGRPGPAACEAFDRVALRAAAGQQPLPGPTDRECLAPGHDLHPGRELRGAPIGCLGQQDLDRALKGILGVVKAERVAARGAAKGHLARIKQGDRVGAGALRRRPPDRRRGLIGDSAHVP